MLKSLVLCLLIGSSFVACRQNDSATVRTLGPAENAARSSPSATPTPGNTNAPPVETGDGNSRVKVTTNYENTGLRHNAKPLPGERYKPAWIEDREKSDNAFEPFCVNTVIGDKIITKCGYQDRGGKVLIKPVYAVVYPFSEGFAGVCPESDTVCGYINETGRLVMKWYQSTGKFSEGAANVSIGATDFYKHGYIDKKGNYVIKPKYSDSAPFMNGVAKVEVQRSLQICINKKDKQIPCPE